MLHAIIAEDAAHNQQRRIQARPAHLKRSEELVDDGRGSGAGSFPAIDRPDPGPAGVSGSLIVAEFDSLEDARAWTDADPYVTPGVYARVDVKPFTVVLP